MARKDRNFDILKDRIIKQIVRNDEEGTLRFILAEGTVYKMFHDQDCCEAVYIEDICGDLEDLLDSPILQAEEVSNSEDPPPESEYSPDSYTWTFYKLATNKGSVTIRWYGESNGYYSESVSFVEEEKN